MNRENTDRRIRYKGYSSYDSYIEHQSGKLPTLIEKHRWFERYHKVLSKYLHERLLELQIVKKGDSVLCLGARLGKEVEVFNEFGCLSIGIDIEPGKDNRYVLCGDFHKTTFSTGVFDIVYTNALDHSFDLTKVLLEAKRVLRPSGHFIIDASLGIKEGGKIDKYECAEWDYIDDLLGVIKDASFGLISRKNFIYPWAGEQLCVKPSCP